MGKLELDHSIVPKYVANKEESENFIIDDVLYSKYKLGDEIVLVYSPHFYLDFTDERCSYATLLLHLPWGPDGEKGLLLHPVSTKEPFPNAVSAVSYYSRKKRKNYNGFPSYVSTMIVQVSEPYFC